MMRRLYPGLLARNSRMFLRSQGNSLGDRNYSMATRSLHRMNENQGCRSLFVRNKTTLPDHDKLTVAEITKEQSSSQAKQLKLFAVVNGKRDAVKIADSEDVAALREAIKKKFALALADYDASDLVVKLNADAKDALQPEDVLRDVLVDASGKPVKYVYVELPAKIPPTPDINVEITRLKQEYQSDFKRPTPCPQRIHLTSMKFWDGTSFPCSGRFPTRAEFFGDERTTVMGIGNAFGTGKTELALHGAEATVKEEPGTQVAYASFSNGYSHARIEKTMEDPNKYAGLWMFAAIHSTKFENGIILSSPEVFKGICVTLLDWEVRYSLALPEIYSDPKRIFIFDEVQRFSYGSLELFVQDLARRNNRLNVVVGAFSVQFQFPSGNRMVDAGFVPPTEDDIESIFQDNQCKSNYENVKLARTVAGCIRLVAFNSQDMWANNAPLEVLRQRYRNIYGDMKTPGILFRAALADVPCSMAVVRNVFKSSKTSLGTALLQPTGDDTCRVLQSPLQTSVGAFDLLDVVDDGGLTRNFISQQLQHCIRPTWKQFEILTAAGPALRLAALSYYLEMKFPENSNRLSQVFGGCCNPMAAKLLKSKIKASLKVRWVNGRGDVTRFQFRKWACKSEIMLVTFDYDHDAHTDNFLIVPLDEEIAAFEDAFVLIGIEAKHTSQISASLATGSFENKIGRFQQVVPEGWKSMFVVATNKRWSSIIPEVEAAVCICSKTALPMLLSESVSFDPHKNPRI